MGLNAAQEFELVISSDLDRIQEVEDFTEKIAIEAALSGDERDSLAIAVTETVNNAIIHGNQNDTNKNVIIRYKITPKQLIIKVKDEGKGFEPQKLPDPRDPENLLKERGRGIFIVRTLMNQVSFESEAAGMVITLIKDRK